ncbi:wall-associated receptor kinase 1 [Impatiens glandulifera]|uniref:wall-associated receptor kinase 1 n=1 Tax=Impatiens glandulifera TaxID=253017 RepID=UPI001FB09068|nr:wall-associated receptor kinase 1 [Impatiens glandulifera]
MKIKLFLVSLFTVFCSSSSQTCQRNCGNQLIKYPFGTSQGCGDHRFQKYVTCNSENQLIFTTHTGCYPITYIDYTNQLIYISDPSMSTCSCSQPSKGFSLDWNAPFTFHDDNAFALLDCTINGGNNSLSSLCDPNGAAICSLLYSCQAISRIDMAISTCCLYAPVDLGPSFEMDLGKLQCGSYSGIYGYTLDAPESWKYGIVLKYKFNFNNEYPILCSDCERSNGICGYFGSGSGSSSSFICYCPGGLNSSTDCLFRATWSHGLRKLPWQPVIWLIYWMVSFHLLLR